MDKKTILDILLFSKERYAKITTKRLTLYLGMVFVGIIDLCYPILYNFSNVFEDKSLDNLIFNIALIPILIILMGFIDVMCFAYPLFDILKSFDKEEGLLDMDSLLIKLMKVYITAHFFIMTFSNIINCAAIPVTPESNIALAYSVAIFNLIVPFWFCGAVTRGVNVLYKFEPPYKVTVYPLTLFWAYTNAYAFEYVINNWVLKVFR